MSAAVLDRAAVATKTRTISAESDAPPDARGWVKGRLLELHELPLPTRVWEWFWYRILHQPPGEYYDLKAIYGSRARARARCVDELDYIVALPYERELGRKVAEDPTFCRPLWKPHEERDRAHAQMYPEDLTSHFSAVNLAAFRQILYELGRQKEFIAKLR